MATGGREKPLQLFNGRGWCAQNHKDPRWKNRESRDAPHAYIAAYSREDARRVVAEYCGRMPAAGELKDYFAPCWGDSMKGVEPVRGLWLQFERFGTPVQVWPAPPTPEQIARDAGWEQDKDRIFRVVDGRVQEAASWEDAIKPDVPDRPGLLQLKVLSSAAGYYIGTVDEEGFPCSRESDEYWPKKDAASKALGEGTWRPRGRESAFSSALDLKKAIAIAMAAAKPSSAVESCASPEL